MDARLYSGRDIQSAYSLCINARGGPCRRARRGSPETGRSRTSSRSFPGPKARAHVAFDETWTSPSLPRAYPIVPVRGEGLTVEDIDGNLFLDFAAGIAVNSTGHAHPQVVAAIKEQAAELIHFSASRLLPADLPGGLPRARPHRADPGRVRAYLGNSGTEVVEASIKLARFATQRPYVVAFLGAFHGRTYGSVSLTASKAKYHAGFGPLLPGIFHAPYGRVEDLRWFDEVLFDKLAPANEVAAIIVEPIQGEGGYIVPEDGFLQGLRDDLRPARDPAHRRRDPVGRRADREDVGGRALGRRARHPADGQGHRVGDAARRDDRPRGAARGMGPRRAWLDLRRQPGRLRGGPRHDRAARGWPGRQRRGPRRAGDRRASRRSSTGSTGSSATSAARA